MITRNEISPGQVTLVIDGSLSGANAQEFQSQLEDITSKEYTLVTLDMAQTTSINSACIGRMLLARKKLKDSSGDIQVKGCSDVIYESLTSLNLDKLINIEREQSAAT